MAAGDDRRTEDLLEQSVATKKLAAAARRAERMPIGFWRPRRTTDSDAAESEAALGDLALAKLRYRDAAAHFRAAADPASRGRSQPRERARLPRPGCRGAISPGAGVRRRMLALEEAIAGYRAALDERAREKRLPLEWASIQNELRQRALDAGGTGERHAHGWRARLLPSAPRWQGWTANAGRCKWAMIQNEPRHCAREHWGTRERHGEAGGRRGGLPRGARGMDPRARAAATGRRTQINLGNALRDPRRAWERERSG